MQNNRIKYAGFWTRLCAAIIDGIIVYIILIIPSIISAITFSIGHPGYPDDPFLIDGLVGTIVLITLKLLAILQILNTVITPWLYFSIMESSRKQASLGKQALGIKVTNLNGESISFERATGRYFAKFISAVSLLVGYLMAAFTQKKQTLHDIIAKTLVVKSKI
jgi:uncharacterized RDD family membrane protein YckC